MRKKRPVVLFEGKVPIAPAAPGGSSGGGSSSAEKLTECAPESPEQGQGASRMKELEEDKPA